MDKLLPLYPQCTTTLQIFNWWCTGKHTFSDENIVAQLSERCEQSGPNQWETSLAHQWQEREQVFIWNQPPKRCSVFSQVVAKDVEPLPIMAWAEGRSYERMEITNRSEQLVNIVVLLRNTYCSPSKPSR